MHPSPRPVPAPTRVPADLVSAHLTATDLTATDPAAGDHALTDLERRALDALDVPRIVAELTELVALPSVGGTGAECEVQHLLADRARELDLDVDLWRLDLDALTTHPDFPGQEVERTEAWGLVASTHGVHPGHGDRPALALQGHVDVVPAGDPARWVGDAFTPA